MEASGVVFRPLPCFSGAGIDAHSHSSSKPSLVGCRDSRVRRFCGVSNYGFSDNGHIQYYRGPAEAQAIRCGGGKKETVKEKELKDMTQKKAMKKRLKLLKGLSRDLSVFSSELGFGLDPQNHDLVDQVKGKMISEATDLLLGQLRQLRAEEKELKKKRKEEKAKLKAALMQNRLDCELSSGSSSESSDSECGEVVDMSSLKKTEATFALPNTLSQEGHVLETQPVIVQDTMLATVSQTANIMSKARGIECGSLQNSPTSLNLTEKIEVCMGGKCKKMGAPALMEEFQRVLGAEDAVVGCKCMGKCRDGPNVRVMNCSDGVDDSVRTPPLCIGVGFEDVSLIVANFFGETQRDMRLATAS